MFGITIVNVVEEPEHFEYWHDAHDAVECFLAYCSDQWIYTMSGVAALDNACVMPVIHEYRDTPKGRLDLLAEVRAFANGVLKAINEDKD